MKRGQWLKLLAGLIAVFVLFQWLGGALGSDRGQAGVTVGVLVAAAALIAEWLLFGKSFEESARAIGLKGPKLSKGLLTALVIGGILFLTIPVFALSTGVTFGFYPGWQFLALGMFFQAGIAEETLFRGYLFGHLRQKHTFWKAAFFAGVPFVFVHLILFYSLPWSIATASILLAIAMSFPLSRLFELDGDRIWAPAIVHFVAQAGVKLTVAAGASAWLFPLFWISVCAVVPLGVYLVPYLEGAAKKTALKAAVGGALFIFMAAQTSIGQAAEAPANDVWTREELTGDWGGARTKLREKGIDLKFRLTRSYQGGVAGDRGRKGEYSGKFDTHFRFDLEKLLGWKRLSVQVKTETRFGRAPSVGSALPLNAGIISPQGEGAYFSVTALNFTQLIPLKKSDFIAVGAGKYYSLDSSREPFTGGAGITKFMNVAFNGNPAVGQTVPTVSNGATFAWVRKGAPFITLAVFDPVASPTRPGLKKLFAQGMTFVPGISFPTNFGKKSGRHSFSGTVTTRKFTPFDQLAQFIVPGAPRAPVVPKGGSWSLTYTFNQYIRESLAQDGQKTGWGVFGVLTIADKTVNPVGGFMTFGIGGSGLLKKRRKDRFGVAYSWANVSRKLRNALAPLVQIKDEHNFEAFYNFSITPWLSLTGDVQIVRPVLKSADRAVVPGVRLVVHL
jgi:porin